jgi:hypothetical protein
MTGLDMFIAVYGYIYLSLGGDAIHFQFSSMFPVVSRDLATSFKQQVVFSRQTKVMFSL